MRTVSFSINRFLDTGGDCERTQASQQLTGRAAGLTGRVAGRNKQIKLINTKEETTKTHWASNYDKWNWEYWSVIKGLTGIFAYGTQSAKTSQRMYAAGGTSTTTSQMMWGKSGWVGSVEMETMWADKVPEEQNEPRPHLWISYWPLLFGEGSQGVLGSACFHSKRRRSDGLACCSYSPPVQIDFLYLL